MGKDLDSFQIGQFQGQNRQLVLGLIVFEIVKSLLGVVYTPSTDNEAVWLGLTEELLDSLETLDSSAPVVLI